MLNAKPLIAGVFLALSALLGGCGGIDGVELNGSVFDYLGVGSNSQKAKEAKVAERQGLVLPPNLERLPEPGSGLAATGSIDAFPVDPEQRKVAAASEADRKHTEFCEKALQKARIMKDLSPVMGPKGRCDKSVLDIINVQSPVEVNVGGPATRKP